MTALAEKVKLVPFLKIFAAVAAGIAIGITAANTMLPLTAAILVPAVIMFSLITKIRLPYTLLILLGVSLIYFHGSNDPIPQNVFTNARVSVVDNPSKGKIVMDIERINGKPIKRERVLFVHGDELHRKLDKDDVADMTLMFESLRSSSIRGKSPFVDLNIKLYAHTHPDSIPNKIGTHPAKHDIKFSVRSFFLTTRNKLAARLDSLGMDDTDKAVLKAIVLGDRHGITPELREMYSLAGVSHILAISGLHIGIICLILNLLFAFIPNYRTPRALKQIMIILLLLFYVMLTGASPSACRAAFMFSLLQYALAYRRSKYMTYNILFASALFFVLIDYTVLSEVSFQLSYLAVLAILLLFDRLSAVIRIKNKFLRYFTDIVIITISVQILTTPLVMYYFGTLSVISIPANLVFTLLLPVLICAAFLYMIFPNDVCEKIITTIFDCYNFTVESLTALPFSGITGYYVTGWDIAVYICILILVWLYLSWFYKTE